MPSKVFKTGDTVIGKAKTNKGRRGKVQSIISDGNKSSYVVEWADHAGTDTVSNRVIDHDHDRESQIIPSIVAAPAAAEPAPVVLNAADRGNGFTTTNLSATFDACLEEIAKIDGYAKFLKAVVRSGASRSGMEQIHTTELFRYLFLKAAEPEVSPSGLVDQAWHTLLLDPLFYMQVCRVLLRRPGAHAYVESIIGHDSLAGEDNAAQKKRYETCLHMYRSVFGQPMMGKYWPSVVAEQARRAGSIAAQGRLEGVGRVDMAMNGKVSGDDDDDDDDGGGGGGGGGGGNQDEAPAMGGRNGTRLRDGEGDRMFAPQSARDEEPVILRVRDLSGEVMVFKIKKDTRLGKVMQAFVERKGVEIHSYRFRFDGSPVSCYDTAKILELEDGDEIDATPAELGC